MIACLLSSYLYSWMAAFGHHEGYEDYFHYMIIFEMIFTIQIGIKFITDYTPDGETLPVKNL